MKLKIENQLMEIIHRHAISTYPDECCGFIFGKENQIRIIDEVLPVRNSKEGDKGRRYVISPTDYIHAEKKAEKKKTTLLGVYHSHPDHQAKPSFYDLEHAVIFFSYIIVSVVKGDVTDTTSWQLNDRKEFQQEEILKT